MQMAIEKKSCNLCPLISIIMNSKLPQTKKYYLYNYGEGLSKCRSINSQIEKALANDKSAWKSVMLSIAQKKIFPYLR